MENSKPHRVAATLADLHIIAEVVGTVTSLWIDLIVAACVIVYHYALADRVRFVSPGEMVAGHTREGDVKVWRNPYGMSRWILFLTYFLATSDSFDFHYPIADAVLSVVFVVVLVLIGKGYAWALAIPAANIVLQATLAILRQPRSLPLTTILTNTQPQNTLIIALICVAVARRYGRAAGAQATTP